MDQKLPNPTDFWLSSEATEQDVAVSSRTRFARNINGFRFSPYADGDTLGKIEARIHEAVMNSEALKGYHCFVLDDLQPKERQFLKESRLISKELEKGGKNKRAYISPDATVSVLINEEDHLRIQTFCGGINFVEPLKRLNQVHDELLKTLQFCSSERLGFLTACPTNVGTGFRASVMLHLPGLNLLKKVEKSLSGIAHHGLTVRGFYGENTEYMGDYYQISNEMTLGKSVEEILTILQSVLDRVLENEKEARLELFRNHGSSTNDQIWRSYALLSHARRMDTNEAMQLLSKMRLGIEAQLFPKINHLQLNNLVMEIQPAHIERRRKVESSNETRDEFRASFLRNALNVNNN
ncbi:MAG: ATP--guanido phosphotransferase [Sumerlaeia bacterium]